MGLCLYINRLEIKTLNLCLGLKSKKTLVKKILNENELDVLCMQELEVDKDYDCTLLNIPGYVLEVEENINKKRVGCYIRENLKIHQTTRSGIHKLPYCDLRP